MVEENNKEQPRFMLGKLYNYKTNHYGKAFLLCERHLVANRARWSKEKLRFTQVGRARGACKFCVLEEEALKPKEPTKVLQDVKVTDASIVKEPVDPRTTTKVVKITRQGGKEDVETRSD